MSYIETPTIQEEWKSYEKHAFRFFFLFFLIQIIPLDWKFFKELWITPWSELHFLDLFKLANYTPRVFAEDTLANWGVGSFADWIVYAFVALIGDLVWGAYDKKSKDYRDLYYWFRVALRYRLALALITYGFYKLFQLQMPFPSLSNLYTNYGDFFAWKIYAQTIAIAPNYESFLGFVEIVAGLLLFYRHTVTFATGVVIGFIGNVAAANAFYDIGDQVYSLYIVLLAAALFIHDVPRLYNLLANQKFTTADKYVPDFTKYNLANVRYALKALFLLFVVVFAFKTLSTHEEQGFAYPDDFRVKGKFGWDNYPREKGLSGFYGYYNVKQFVVNKDTIAYSRVDPKRWQDVIFEQWPTISIKSRKPLKADLTNGVAGNVSDFNRTYESAGVGGRHYYHYEADTLRKILVLKNKNKNHAGEQLVLSYTQPDNKTVVLDGIDENKDTIHVVLNRIDKNYLLFEGRRKPVKL